MEGKEFTAKVGRLLEKDYGKEVWFPGGKAGGKRIKVAGKVEGTPLEGSSLDVLVGTILSQNTSDRNSFPAFERLKRKFPKWERVLEASDSEIASLIKSAGLANIKAKRIKEALAEVKKRNGKLSIANLAGMEKERAKEWLKSLPGVGPKTAAVVLCFSFGMPVFPVDTHIFRVANRLGLIRTKSVEKAHEMLEAMVEPRKVGVFHVNLIRHGRKVCVARKPLCWKCVLARMCKFPHKTKKPLN